MARRRRRDEDDDFDEDDEPRREKSGGGNTAVWVGVGVGAVLVLGLVVFLVARKRQDTAKPAPTPPAPAPVVRPPAVPDESKGTGEVLRTRPAAAAPRGKPAANWASAVGLWRRERAADDPGSLPVEFEFRKDFTARAEHHRPRDTVIHETLVEVQLDQGPFLTLVLHMENGSYTYGFKTGPDGTLVMQGHGRGPDLVYVRVK